MLSFVACSDLCEYLLSCVDQQHPNPLASPFQRNLTSDHRQNLGRVADSGLPPPRRIPPDRPWRGGSGQLGQFALVSAGDVL